MHVGFFKVHDYTKKSNICEIWKNWANIGVFMFVKWFIIIGCICIKGNSDQHIIFFKHLPYETLVVCRIMIWLLCCAKHICFPREALWTLCRLLLLIFLLYLFIIFILSVQILCWSRQEEKARLAIDRRKKRNRQKKGRERKRKEVGWGMKQADMLVSNCCICSKAHL